MTGTEINRALALAIGWKPQNIRTYPITGNTYCDCGSEGKLFDYRDWRIIGPIAERFDCFPWIEPGTWVCAARDQDNQLVGFVRADTPQKAIAMAVIGGAA